MILPCQIHICTRWYIYFFIAFLIGICVMMVMVLSCDSLITFFDYLPAVRQFKFYQCECPEGYAKGHFNYYLIIILKNENFVLVNNFSFRS